MIIAFVVSLLTVAGLVFPGYFPMHDDLQVMRIFQLEQCFADGQIPCRWVSDMTFGFGQAMFNYYSAFPYYLGILIRLVFPISILDTVKVLFAVSLVGGSLGMYLLGKEFFGKRGALVASILYAFAPYRAVNVYVRGAMAESFSLAILPFLWLAIYKSVKEPSYKNVVFLATSLMALLITHNISTLMYFSFTAVWALFWVIQNFKIKSVLSLFLGLVFGIALSGFFILPVFFERSLIQEEIFVSDYSNFTGHFVSLNQIFVSRFWGYGGSIFGDNDGMSFQIGWPHWWVAVIAGGVAAGKMVRKVKATHLMVLILLFMAVLSLFLSHNKSTPLWQALSMIEFVQFPWRFLGVAVFLISFVGGSLVYVGRGIGKNFLLFLVIVMAIVLNTGYFKPERTYDWLTDEIKLSGEDFLVQQKAAALDYLPTTVVEPPLNTAPSVPVLVEGDAELPNLTKTSSSFFFDANVYEESVIDVPIIYFPEWEVYMLEGPGRKISVYPSEPEGLIRVELPPGKHMIYGRLINTRVRDVGNGLTVISFFLMVAVAVLTGTKRRFLGLK